MDFSVVILRCLQKLACIYEVSQLKNSIKNTLDPCLGGRIHAIVHTAFLTHYYLFLFN